MKGRFRKGKKAYKLGLVNKSSERYKLFLERIKQQGILNLKVLSSALSVMSGAMGQAAIMMRARPKDVTIEQFRAQQAIDLVENACITAQSIAKVYA